MGSWIGVVQNHVMATNYYFVVADDDRTKRASMATVNSFVSLFYRFRQELVIPILYRC